MRPAPKEALVVLLKSAADGLRLDILRALQQDSFAVQELATIFSVPQPGMSHHLKLMATAGLLATRRQGNTIFYRRAVVDKADDGRALQRVLYDTVDAIDISAELRERIAMVRTQRAKQSKRFFEKHAKKFTERQGQLCDIAHYIAGIKQLLDLTGLSQTSRVMEVGPGQGFVLEELVGRFSDVVALDNSGEMLALTKQSVADKADKIRYQQAALEDYVLQGAKFNAVVLNMVLHHMSSPAAVFEKLRTLVAESGFLLIADLASHNQDWVRLLCGDIWLGFEPSELAEWGEKSGFSEVQSLYLGLKNGFQIQLRLFQKSVTSLI